MRKEWVEEGRPGRQREVERGREREGRRKEGHRKKLKER